MSEYVHTTPCARKVHCCDTCGLRVIRPGQTYTRQVTFSDGRAQTYKECAQCTDWRDAFEALEAEVCRDDGECWDLYEVARDMSGEEWTQALKRRRMRYDFCYVDDRQWYQEEE